MGQGYAALLSGRGCGTASHSVMVSSEVVGETYSSTVVPVRLMINGGWSWKQNDWRKLAVLGVSTIPP